MLEAGSDFTAQEVALQQMDVRDAFAVRYLPMALRAAAAVDDSAALRLLSGWDARATTDSRAAPLFYAWYEALRRRVGFDEFAGSEIYFPRAALNRMLDAGGSAWVDDVSTPERETLEELSAAAMREAIGIAAGRPWGELHSTRIAHALGVSEALDRALSLDLGPFPNRGSPYTVNVAGYGSRPPFVNGHGPSLRHVVDLADPDGSGGFVLPGGQSGVPTSSHYRDQLDPWLEGRLWRIPLDRAAAAARAVERMTLSPAR
jgi:penicillin G amidase